MNKNINKNAETFKKGQSGNPNGRPPKMKTMITTIPKDAQERIYSALYEVLAKQSHKDAIEYLKASDFGEYGFIKELAIRTLSGKNGWQAFNDIMDRLFGKARQEVDVSTTQRSREEVREMLFGKKDDK